MYYPIKISSYISKEFLLSLFVVFFVFLSLSLLINCVSELVFLKDKKVSNFFWMTVYLTLAKTPNTIIELSVFIFLFSGILFFVKLQKNNEINTILLSGMSKYLPILVPAIISFCFGLFIIFALSPIAANSLRFYEEEKRFYSSNENLIVINKMGLWFVESGFGKYSIVRADKILSNDFTKLNNVTIYNLDQNFNFIKRYDIKNVLINEKEWILKNTKILINDANLTSNKEIKNLKLTSSIDISSLKSFFLNVDTISFWEILKTIKKLNSRGYGGEELKAKLHKYLSLPLYLFGTILVSTMFTIGMKKQYNTFMYLFFGIIVGFLIYFLNDLSVAIGLSNKLPLIISVWSPIMLIIILGSINLIKINE
jgi:lipopolysaccharide export system permease protein